MVKRIVRIRLSRLDLYETMQCRTAWSVPWTREDERIAKRYAKAMLHGDIFPPVWFEHYPTKRDVRVFDGSHRLRAAQILGLRTLRGQFID